MQAVGVAAAGAWSTEVAAPASITWVTPTLTPRAKGVVQGASGDAVTLQKRKQRCSLKCRYIILNPEFLNLASHFAFQSNYQ